MRKTETLNEIAASRNNPGPSGPPAAFRGIGGLSPLVVTCSLILHLSFFFIVQYVPSFFPDKPLLDEIMTVDLVSLPEVADSMPPAAPPTPVKAPEPPAAVPSTLVVAPVVVEQTVTPAPVEVKPISLKPLKRKIRKAADTRLAEEKAAAKREAARLRELQRQRELAQQRAREQQLALAQAREAEKLAAKEAKLARQLLADSLRSAASSQAGRSGSGGSRGGARVDSQILQQYLVQVDERVRRYWELPDMKSWPPDLETVVAIVIRQDGSVTRTEVEKKSGDPQFDSFVMETIKSASPMPRFPLIFKENSIEVGLRFRPGALSM